VSHIRRQPSRSCDSTAVGSSALVVSARVHHIHTVPVNVQCNEWIGTIKFTWTINYVCTYPLSLHVPLYISQSVIILWYHRQDDNLACGHSVSLVLPPGTLYQQTLELHQTLANFKQHLKTCLFSRSYYASPSTSSWLWTAPL